MFNNGKLDLERLKDLVKIVGKERLILDLSCCRKKVIDSLTCFGCSYYETIFVFLHRMEDMRLLLIGGRSSATSCLMRNRWSFLEVLQMSFWCMVLMLKERSKRCALISVFRVESVCN